MTTFAPYDWPQDSLQIPPGLGGLPQVEAANAIVTRRDGKTFTASFDVVSAGPRFAPIETRILPTDQDGDFWCQSIYAAGFVNALSYLNPPGRVRIRDIRTGNPLFYGSGPPLSFFNVNADWPVSGGPHPAGWRSTSTLIQPFCFTRNGGIEISIAGLVAPTNYATAKVQIQIALGGWTEYAHASE